jgi:hypothetical protein
MKRQGKSISEVAIGRRTPSHGTPTRRDVLALIGPGAALVVAGASTPDPTEIVIVDGWVLSPADLQSRA